MSVSPPRLVRVQFRDDGPRHPAVLDRVNDEKEGSGVDLVTGEPFKNFAYRGPNSPDGNGNTWFDH